MKTKTQHTPTPVQLQLHYLGDNAITEFDQEYSYLVVMPDSYHNWAEEVPTEEFILARFKNQTDATQYVRAVNSHDALVKALKEASDILEAVSGINFTEELQRFDNVITQAEGKGE